MSKARGPDAPVVVVIGGPNGAGKSTIAKSVLADTVGIDEFVNADTIAQGLSAFDPERAAFLAGRVMRSRLRELAEGRASFAFESTLASRSFAPWLRELTDAGYEVHLIYVSLESPDLAVRRVKVRVKSGGHHVPEEVIRRRFVRSLRNLFDLYVPIAMSWRVFDNSTRSLRLIAECRPPHQPHVFDEPALIRLRHAAKANQTQDDDPS